MTYEEILKYNQDLARQQSAVAAENAARLKQQKAAETEAQNKLLKSKADSQKSGVYSAYREIYDENAVNQYVSERRVSEAMANAGLTDSGLNRTQQTAIALTRGNADAKARTGELAAIKSIEQALGEDIADNELKLAEYGSKLDSQLASDEIKRMSDAKADADKQYLNLVKQTGSASGKSTGTGGTGSGTGAGKASVPADSTSRSEIYANNLKTLTTVLKEQERRGIDVMGLADFAKKYIIEYDLSAEDTDMLLARYGIEKGDLPKSYFSDIKKEQQRLDRVLVGFDEYTVKRAQGIGFNIDSVLARAFEDYHITEDGGAKLMPQLVANGYLTSNDVLQIARFYDDYIAKKRIGRCDLTDDEIKTYVSNKESSGAVSHNAALYMNALLKHYTSPI